MTALAIYLMLAKPPTFPPANPCSNPVKCESYRPRTPTNREGKGPRK